MNQFDGLVGVEARFGFLGGTCDPVRYPLRRPLYGLLFTLSGWISRMFRKEELTEVERNPLFVIKLSNPYSNLFQKGE
jgi:hypothetical protein